MTDGFIVVAASSISLRRFGLPEAVCGLSFWSAQAMAASRSGLCGTQVDDGRSRSAGLPPRRSPARAAPASSSSLSRRPCGGSARLADSCSAAHAKLVRHPRARAGSPGGGRSGTCPCPRRARRQSSAGDDLFRAPACGAATVHSSVTETTPTSSAGRRRAWFVIIGKLPVDLHGVDHEVGTRRPRRAVSCSARASAKLALPARRRPADDEGVFASRVRPSSPTTYAQEPSSDRRLAHEFEVAA